MSGGSRALSPASLAPPAARYAHAVLSEGTGRWLHTSGVVPAAPGGGVPDGLAEQAELVWSTIATRQHVVLDVLAGAGIGTLAATAAVSLYHTLAGATYSPGR